MVLLLLLNEDTNIKKMKSLLATAILLWAGDANAVQFAITQLYTTDACEASGLYPVYSVIGRTSPVCLQDFGAPIDQTIKSYIYDPVGATLGYGTTDCTGDFLRNVWTCAASPPSLSVQGAQIATRDFPDDQVYETRYYPSAACSPSEYVEYTPGINDMLGSGPLDTCTATFLGSVFGSAMQVSFANETHLVSTSYSEPLACTGTPLTTRYYPVGQCVQVQDADQVIFMYVTAGQGTPAPGEPASPVPTPAPTPLIVLEGQVNLNQGAIELNKQVAGASVGVLCGFTALLVLISMTGILG